MDQLYNRYDAADRVETILFRADKVLQSAELNELQSMAAARLAGVANALLKDGDIIRDAGIVVDPLTGETRCAGGAVYLAGAVRGVPPAEIVIPVVGSVAVGIYLYHVEFTELADPSLLNPAVGTRGYMEPGAGRLLIDPTWGRNDDGQLGDFFPVWFVDDGYVRAKEAPPNLDSVTQALARYDRDSAGGSYVVEGLVVRMMADQGDGRQVYTLAEGRARVNGYPVQITAGQRLIYDAQPDVRAIADEPHLSATAGAQRIDLDATPVRAITRVSITRETTEEITHGGFLGAADLLPDASVLAIISVDQGATHYVAGVDYALTAGQVDWSPGGAEPAPGSTYDVVYRHIVIVAPDAPDATGFSVTGAVPDTLVLVDYEQMVPRIDRLVMDQDGHTDWLQGVAATRAPQAPTVPASMLLLASVVQTWDVNRHILQDGVRVVTMQALAGYQETQFNILQDLAELRLAVDVSGRYTGIKKGLFADPMYSNAMRDAGLAQDALIANGALHLPFASIAHHQVTSIATPQAPAYVHVPVVAQTLRTGSMPVNPYMAFRPITAEVTLAPAVDRSPVAPGAAFAASQIDVAFTLRGFGAGEALATVKFNGLDVVPQPLPGGNLVANGAGVVQGTVHVPAGIGEGIKLVEFTGAGGSAGSQNYTVQRVTVQPAPTPIGSAVIGPFDSSSPPAPTQAPIRYINLMGTPYPIYAETSAPPSHMACVGPSTDPLAQTFTLQSARQLSGVDLWFTEKSTLTIVQIRETEGGVPSAKVLIETRVPAAQIVTDGTPTRVEWAPFAVAAGRELAIVVLCDDAVTALAVAELGKWDAAAGRWVTSQPYQVGVLLSSSNANTWTAHQDKDLAFRLLAASYTQTERVIDLGIVPVVGATDLIVLGYAERPAAAAELVFELALPGGGNIQVMDSQPLRLAAPITGDVHLYARLRGNADMAAVLHPGIQLVEAALAASGTYISLAIKADADSNIKAVFEADIPSGAAVALDYKGADGGDVWAAIPYLESTLNSAGVREYTHQLAGVAETALRVRVTSSGTPAARPTLRNLRVVVV